MLILALSFIQFCAIAQISTREITEEKKYAKPLTYDSTYFFYKPDVDFNTYLNQRIFILPKSSINKEDGYRYFYTKNIIGGYGDNSIVYMPNLESSSNIKPTQYSALANKYLRILDIETRSSWDGYSDLSVKLYHEENEDTIFYCPPSSICQYRNLTDIPFIMVGFFEYSKNKFVGKEFIAKDSISEYTSYKGNFSSEPLIDINSGEKIKCKENSKWICTEITLVDVKKDYKYLVPVLVFKDNLNREIIVNFAKYIYNKDYNEEKNIFYATKAIIDDFYSKEEFDFLKLQEQEQQKLKIQMEQKLEMANQKRLEKLTNKYGSKYANLIFKEKVVIGMSKVMCKEAWGAPYQIDKVTLEDGTYEVWSYNYNTLLYFENDILKLIKE